MVSVPTTSLKAEREPSVAPADPSRLALATAAALAEAMALITSGPMAFSSNAVDSFARCSPLPDCRPPSSMPLCFCFVLFYFRFDVVRVLVSEHATNASRSPV